jgi:ATP-dependent Clp protease adaptor protein ClpS
MGHRRETETRPEEATRAVPNPGRRWKVLLHNDDRTTFEFVIDLLVNLFRKDRSEAARLTHEVHTHGLAIVCVTHFERAELYVEQVRSLSRPRGFPLTASIEPE